MSRGVYSEEVGKRKRRLIGVKKWKAYGQPLWMMRRGSEVAERLDWTPSTQPCHQMMSTLRSFQILIVITAQTISCRHIY